jgi:N-acetylneuraminic acid mutarotase
MRGARTLAVAFAIDSKGYVGLGYSDDIRFADLWEYDPQVDRWTRKAPLPGPARFRAIGFSLNGKGYLGTGIASQNQTSAVVFKDVWEYDPGTDAWTQQPDFSGPARGAAVSFVPGSRIFIGTGVDAGRQVLADFWRTGPAGADR